MHLVELILEVVDVFLLFFRVHVYASYNFTTSLLRIYSEYKYVTLKQLLLLL